MRVRWPSWARGARLYFHISHPIGWVTFSSIFGGPKWIRALENGLFVSLNCVPPSDNESGILIVHGLVLQRVAL